MFGFKRRLRAFLAWFQPKPEQGWHEARIEALIAERGALRRHIDGLRKAKKKHSHLTNKLVELTNRQMELEALTYGPTR